MSRIRSIHPGLWTDEAFVCLSPLARLFLLGIWNECDDQGAFEWSPLKLKMRILPADNADATELLAEIEASRCIMRYEVGGKSYGAVRNFCQYQRPKKPNKVHPETAEMLAWVNIDARSTRDGSEKAGNQLPTGGEKPRQMEDGGGSKEDGSNPPKPPRKRGGEGKHLLPEDWELPPVESLTPKAKACAEQWTAESYETHGEAFANYWRSRRGMNSDWRLTWCNRIVALHSQVMRDQKFGNAPSSAPNDVDPKKWTAERRAEYARKWSSSTGPPGQPIGGIVSGIVKQAGAG